MRGSHALCTVCASCVHAPGGYAPSVSLRVCVRALVVSLCCGWLNALLRAHAHPVWYCDNPPSYMQAEPHWARPPSCGVAPSCGVLLHVGLWGTCGGAVTRSASARTSGCCRDMCSPAHTVGGARCNCRGRGRVLKGWEVGARSAGGWMDWGGGLRIKHLTQPAPSVCLPLLHAWGDVYRYARARALLQDPLCGCYSLRHTLCGSSELHHTVSRGTGRAGPLWPRCHTRGCQLAPPPSHPAAPPPPPPTPTTTTTALPVPDHGFLHTLLQQRVGCDMHVVVSLNHQPFSTHSPQGNDGRGWQNRHGPAIS